MFGINSANTTSTIAMKNLILRCCFNEFVAAPALSCWPELVGFNAWELLHDRVIGVCMTGLIVPSPRREEWLCLRLH